MYVLFTTPEALAFLIKFSRWKFSFLPCRSQFCENFVFNGISWMIRQSLLIFLSCIGKQFCFYCGWLVCCSLKRSRWWINYVAWNWFLRNFSFLFWSVFEIRTLTIRQHKRNADKTFSVDGAQWITMWNNKGSANPVRKSDFNSFLVDLVAEHCRIEIDTCMSWWGRCCCRVGGVNIDLATWATPNGTIFVIRSVVC